MLNRPIGLKVLSLVVLIVLATALASVAAAIQPATETKLTASDGAAGDRFGVRVAVDGDTVVISSLLDDDAGTDSGSVYVFFRSGGTWTQQAKLTASDAAAGDVFGEAIGISGDTVVVGADFNDDAGDRSGSAYVFVRSGSNWTQQAKLTAGDARLGDLFGRGVDISGDYLVVGASGNDDRGNLAGAAYVFVRSGTTWTQQAKLFASDASPIDRFGNTGVAISGATVIVGSLQDDDAGSNSGSAYVFVRSGTTWTQEAKLTASDAAAEDAFGALVGISGDTVVVGSVLDDDAGTNSGSAYVFVRSGTTWTQEAKLTASDAAAEDAFGALVGISGDTVVVGSVLDDDAGTNSGSAYVFVRSGTTWTEEAKLTASDAAAGDAFGRPGIRGDTVIVGASGDDDLGTGSGSAYVFVRSGTTWTQEAKLTASDGAAGDRFGVGTGIDGGTLVVGADVADGASTDSGAVYMYELNAAPEVTTPGDQTNDEGDTVSLAIAATDPDDDALTYSATRLPDGLSINASTGLISGTLTFESATTVTVTVSVSDGTLTTEVDFYWTVIDVNRVPVVTSPGDQVNNEGDTVSLDIVASDPDNDTLAYGATGLPDGLSINASTGEVSGVLSYDAATVTSVMVSVSDAEDVTEMSFTWTVNNVNRAPEITSSGDQVNDEGDTVSLAISAADPDSDTVTYSASGLPVGLSIDAMTGEISGELGFDASTVTTATVSVSDGDINSETSFLWTVNDVIIEFAIFELSKLDVRFSDGPVDDRFIIHGSFTLGGESDGVDLSIDDVTVLVGTASITIPAGSFAKRGKNRKFDGVIDTEIVSMDLTDSGASSFDFKIDVKSMDLSGTANPMDVQLRIADDVGSANVRLEGELKLKAN